jgi:hypothetical protein
MIGGLKAAAVLRKGVEGLKPEEADYVMRNLKKQGLGVAVFTLGYLGAANVGGFYTGKRDEEDLKAGDVTLFGMHLPHWMMHTPLWTMLQMGATFRRIKDSNEAKEKDGYIGDALKTSFKSVIDGIPFVQTPVKMYHSFEYTGSVSKTAGEIVKSLLIPPDLALIAEKFDKGDDGEARKVQTKGFWEQIQKGMPGLRNKLETKE